MCNHQEDVLKLVFLFYHVLLKWRKHCATSKTTGGYFIISKRDPCGEAKWTLDPLSDKGIVSACPGSWFQIDHLPPRRLNFGRLRRSPADRSFHRGPQQWGGLMLNAAASFILCKRCPSPLPLLHATRRRALLIAPNSYGVRIKSTRSMFKRHQKKFKVFHLLTHTELSCIFLGGKGRSSSEVISSQLLADIKKKQISGQVEAQINCCVKFIVHTNIYW